MFKIAVKTFQELSNNELYDIIQLRSEVFVVEQNCVYQDLDGKDSKAVHVMGIKKGILVAYTRIFKPGDYFKEASIGRVVVKDSERKYGYGGAMMKASIRAIKEYYDETKIYLSAQAYLKVFYNSFDFEQIGEGYLEDGIPHIGMLKK